MRHLIVLALLLSTAHAALACGGSHGRSRKRGNVRACFANQKTLVGAIEMWGLDKNCQIEGHLERGEDPVASLRKTASGETCGYDHGAWKPMVRPPVTPVPDRFMKALVSQGYLQSPPVDPGRGKETPGAYALTSFGNGIICLYHGQIQDAAAHSARQQLKTAGVDDPAMLELASDEDPLLTRWYEDPIQIALLIGALLGFLWTLGRGIAGAAAGQLLSRSVFYGVIACVILMPVAMAGMEVVAVGVVVSQAGGFCAAILLAIARRSFAGAPVEKAVAVVRRPPAPLPLVKPEGLRCAVCATDGGPTGWVACPACEAAHHRECWTFQDGCAAFGCSLAHGRWRSGDAVARATPSRTEQAKPTRVAVNWPA